VFDAGPCSPVALGERPGRGTFGAMAIVLMGGAGYGWVQGLAARPLFSSTCAVLWYSTSLTD